MLENYDLEFKDTGTNLRMSWRGNKKNKIHSGNFGKRKNLQRRNTGDPL